MKLKDIFEYMTRINHDHLKVVVAIPNDENWKGIDYFLRWSNDLIIKKYGQYIDPKLTRMNSVGWNKKTLQRHSAYTKPYVLKDDVLEKFAPIQFQKTYGKMIIIVNTKPAIIQY